MSKLKTAVTQAPEASTITKISIMVKGFIVCMSILYHFYSLCWPVLNPQITGDATFPGDVI